MLTGKCIHPDIIRIMSLCGHGDKILIADGNYPLASRSGDAEKIYLGITPGIPSVTDVLASLQSIANFERAEVMQPNGDSEPEIFTEFRSLLDNMELEKLGRYEFYDACSTAYVCLAISTGEKRTFANILLTLGCA